MAHKSIISSSFAPPAPPASAQLRLPSSSTPISRPGPLAPAPAPLPLPPPPPPVAPPLKGLEDEAALPPESVAREIAAAEASPAVITEVRPAIAAIAAAAAAVAAIFPCGEGGNGGGACGAAAGPTPPPPGSPAAASRGALAATTLKASRPEDPGMFDNATRAAGTACAESEPTVCHGQGRGGA